LSRLADSKVGISAGAARISEPIIVIGAPRSGTTLLTKVLEAHPDVAVSLEPRLVWRYGNDRRSDELRPQHATPRVVDHVHRSFAALLRDRGAARLVEKTPANAVRPRFIDAVFPDARYVHITRNGWAAVPSMRTFWERRATGFDTRQVGKLQRRLREAHPSQLPFYVAELTRRLSRSLGGHVPLYGPRLAGLQAVADELGRLEAAALQWRTCVEQTAAFGRALPAGRYLEVHLEDLDSERVEEIMSFCGLRAASSVRDRFQELYRPQAARRRASLSDEERAVLAPYVLAANTWLGYHDAPEPSLIDETRR
jgi:hypothetical protein